MANRWPEPKRVLVGSFSVIGALLTALTLMAWSVVEKNGDRIDEIEGIMPEVHAHYKDIRDRLTSIEARLLSIEGKIDERNGLKGERR